MDGNGLVSTVKGVVLNNKLASAGMASDGVCVFTFVPCAVVVVASGVVVVVVAVVVVAVPVVPIVFALALALSLKTFSFDGGSF